jgi:hypothetical protein
MDEPNHSLEAEEKTSDRDEKMGEEQRYIQASPGSGPGQE